MVDTLEKSTFPCGDSDDDFDQDFQMLDNSDFYFKKLDLPTENEKQVMRTKFFMSDVFDQTHDYQMVNTTELWEYREFDR